MNTEEIIQGRLMGYLNSRTPPRAIAGKPGMQAEEADRILRTLCRYNPRGNLLDWWQRVEDELSATCETYAWPLPRDFAKAAERASKAMRGDIKSEPSGHWEPDPVKVAADRMSAGESVGEHWLYGPLAVEVEARGDVSAETLQRYRSAAYFAKVISKRDGSEDRSKADAWEKAARSRHDAARNRGRQAAINAPDLFKLVKKIGGARETASGPQAHAMRPEEYMTPEEIARAGK